MMQWNAVELRWSKADLWTPALLTFLIRWWKVSENWRHHKDCWLPGFLDSKILISLDELNVLLGFYELKSQTSRLNLWWPETDSLIIGIILFQHQLKCLMYKTRYPFSAGCRYSFTNMRAAQIVANKVIVLSPFKWFAEFNILVWHILSSFFS